MQSTDKHKLRFLKEPNLRKEIHTEQETRLKVLSGEIFCLVIGQINEFIILRNYVLFCLLTR
jgi:hypothetical protein